MIYSNEENFCMKCNEIIDIWSPLKCIICNQNLCNKCYEIHSDECLKVNREKFAKEGCNVLNPYICFLNIYVEEVGLEILIWKLSNLRRPGKSLTLYQCEKLYHPSIDEYQHKFIICGGKNIKWLRTTVAVNCFENNSENEFLVENLASMHVRRADHKLISANGYMYSIGGLNTNWIRACEKYDISSNKWLTLPDIPISDFEQTLVLVKNRYIYSFQGKHSTSIFRFDIYIEEKWETINQDYNILHCGMNIPLFDSSILIFGKYPEFTGIYSFDKNKLKIQQPPFEHLVYDSCYWYSFPKKFLQKCLIIFPDSYLIYEFDMKEKTYNYTKMEVPEPPFPKFKPLQKSEEKS